MTRPLFGNPADLGDIGDRQSPSLPQTPLAPPPIILYRWFRNTKHPNAEAQQRIAQAANHGTIYRSKEVFGICAPCFSGNGSFYVNGDIWHFAFHTGPYTSALFARLLMNQPFTGGNSYATVKIYSDASLATLVASEDFNYGSGQGTGGSPGVWQTMQPVEKFLTGLSADTDYYGVISGSNSAFVAAAAIMDCPSLTESAFGGYLALNYTTHTPILGIDRSNAHTLMKNMWKRGGSKVLNWAVTPGNNLTGSDSTDSYRSITTTSTTLKNILDVTSTTVSSSTPGWTLDMRYKDRISQSSGVPCVMKIFGRATSPTNGSVVLKNSAGTTIATVTTSTTTNAWASSGAFNLPATLDKYDLQFKSGGAGSAFHLYAVSIWEYEA